MFYGFAKVGGVEEAAESRLLIKRHSNIEFGLREDK